MVLGGSAFRNATEQPKVKKPLATIGLLSDTHGHFDEFFRTAFLGVDEIWHAGDIGTESVLRKLETIAPVVAVRGNIDGGPLRFLPLTQTREVQGARIGMVHIAGSPTRPPPATVGFIRAEKLDVFICGHSHIWMIQKVAGSLWINPGASGLQGFHQVRSAARLRVFAGPEFELDRVNLAPRWPSGEPASDTRNVEAEYDPESQT